MSRSPQGGVEFRYTSPEGEDVVTTLAAARSDLVTAGLPVRRFGSYAGMRHYPGWWWSATTGDLIGYESLLERDRLMLADFDQGVVAIASQPFGITGDNGGVTRRHVPDYLLRMVDGTVVVVDVKPARLLAKPEIAEVLVWTGRLMAERGWRYEVWSGAEATRLTNVRFLGQGRRWDRVDPEALSALHACGSKGQTLAGALSAAARSGVTREAHRRAAMLALLWWQVWVVDLDVPLTGATRIERVREDAHGYRGT